MRELFFLSIIVGSVLAACLYGGWLLLRALHEVYRNWQLGKELDELEAHTEQRGQQQKADNSVRLNNGCEHDFEIGPGALPRRICRKCGIEAVQSVDLCDHIWHRASDNDIVSYCDKCGKEVTGSIGIPQPQHG